jgi:hypothetical protein
MEVLLFYYVPWLKEQKKNGALFDDHEFVFVDETTKKKVCCFDYMTIAKEYKEKFELTFEHAWTDWCKPEYAFSSYADNVVKDGNTFTVGEFETFYNDTANHQKKKPSLKAMFVEPYSRKRKASEETSSGQIAKKSKLTKTQEILKNETAAIVAVIKSDESYKRINKNDEEEDQDRLELIEALGNSLDIKVNSKKYQAMKQDDSDETAKTIRTIMQRYECTNKNTANPFTIEEV